MKNEFSNGIFVWILYSKINGSILKASKEAPTGNEQIPYNYAWTNMIIHERLLKKIFMYSVTNSGLQKTISKFFVTR